MEYTRAVGAEVMLQMVRINCQVSKVETFGGDRLRRFIRDHKD